MQTTMSDIPSPQLAARLAAIHSTGAAAEIVAGAARPHWEGARTFPCANCGAPAWFWPEVIHPLQNNNKLVAVCFSCCGKLEEQLHLTPPEKLRPLPEHLRRRLNLTPMQVWLSIFGPGLTAGQADEMRRYLPLIRFRCVLCDGLTWLPESTSRHAANEGWIIICPRCYWANPSSFPAPDWTPDMDVLATLSVRLAGRN